MTRKEILIAARALLAKGWCQGTYALNTNGEQVRYNDPGAVSWCMSGALGAALATALATGPLVFGFSEVAGHVALFLPTDCPTIPQYNDTPGRTQAEVLALMDRAIEACT